MGVNRKRIVQGFLLVLWQFALLSQAPAQEADRAEETAATGQEASATNIAGRKKPAAKTPAAVSIRGSARLSADYYSMNPDPQGVVSARRPSPLYRLLFAPTISIYDLRIPISLILSSKQTNVTTPRASDQTFRQFLENPMNRISVAPQLGWARINLGHHVPRYSELTMGDMQIFGAGFDLRPDKFRVAAFRGTSQRAIEPALDLGTPGAFQRDMLAAHLGFGGRKSFRVGLTAVKMEDDINSIEGGADHLRPEEGFSSSISFFVPIADLLFVDAEIAASVFTRDLRAAEVDDEDLDAFNSLLPIRESTRADYAGALTIGVDQSDWGLEARVRLLGDGFVALGYPFLQSDQIEYSLAPRLRLFEGKLDLSGSIGQRENNISDTKAETATQLIGSANILAQITENFALNASYSNFGFRNNVDENNEARVEMISQALAVSPMLTIDGEEIRHSLAATLSLDDFTDRNVISGAMNSNNTRSVFLNYSARFTTLPLSCNLSLSNLQSDPDEESGLDSRFGALSISINSLHLGGSYRLLEGDLTPSLKFSYSASSTADFSADTNLLMRLGLKYKVLASTTLSLNASLKLYSYGSARPDVSYTENFLQTAFATRF